MEKEKKIKVTSAAKDLEISPEKVVEVLSKEGIHVKKTGSVTVEELNLVIERITQSKQVDNFDRFFADKTTSAEAKAAKEKKKAAKQERENAKKDKKRREGKGGQNNNNKDGGNRDSKQNGNNKQRDDNNNKKKNDRRNGKNNNNNNSNNNKDTQPKVNAAVKQSEPKQQPPAPRQKKKSDRQPAKRHEHGTVTLLNTNANVSDEFTENLPKTRTVDTRGSYVDLDKYNERYDNLAGDSERGKNKNKFANAQKKQKINQKSQQYNKPKSRKKAVDPEEKLRRQQLEKARKKQLEVKIPDEITVGELATRLKAAATQVIKELMKLGVMATVNQTIDYDTAALAADALGAKVEHEVVVTIEEKLIDETEDAPETLKPRPPVVCIMGHVDHGKTSILDKIRNTHVTNTEAGGITQAIGAYQAEYNGRTITFLDTPGHEAFTAMRARGADTTDIAVLVVAADDGVMPQTVESINHAKAAGIPIIVAINKMDKPDADPQRVKNDLLQYEIVGEENGGDTMFVEVSAKTGQGIDELLEDILLIADVNELSANPDRAAAGTVLEARLDKGRGPVATLLVQKGTLHKGDVIIAGTSVGKVRVMTSFTGKQIKEAGPSVPVEITGLDEVPEAGDTFNAVEDEKLAKQLAEQRKTEQKESKFDSAQKITLDNLFDSIEEGEMKELPIIVKADVQGSAEAVKQSLEKLSDDEVKVKVIHAAVGAIKESDVMLAQASNAIIVGFNVRPEPIAAENAKRDHVEIRLYRVIYDAIEEIQKAMKGMLEPDTQEVIYGRAEVRSVFKITGVGTVAGCMVIDGKALRNAKARVVRDGVVVADDNIAGLQRFKDSVKEVAQGYECGISLEKFADIKEGDIIEIYNIEEVKE